MVRDRIVTVCGCRVGIEFRRTEGWAGGGALFPVGPRCVTRASAWREERAVVTLQTPERPLVLQGSERRVGFAVRSNVWRPLFISAYGQDAGGRLMLVRILNDRPFGFRAVAVGVAIGVAAEGGVDVPPGPDYSAATPNLSGRAPWHYSRPAVLFGITSPELAV